MFVVCVSVCDTVNSAVCNCGDVLHVCVCVCFFFRRPFTTGRKNMILHIVPPMSIPIGLITNELVFLILTLTGSIGNLFLDVIFKFCNFWHMFGKKVTIRPFFFSPRPIYPHQPTMRDYPVAHLAQQLVASNLITMLGLTTGSRHFLLPAPCMFADAVEDVHIQTRPL